MKNQVLFFVLFIFCVAQANAQAGGEITPKGITFPRYTDANRPTGPLAVGTVIFNTSQNTHQSWNGSTWQNLVTGGGGGSPWSASGNSVFVNNANRVGINTASPTATLEIQGGLLVSTPYTVTASPATTTYTMPYNGTIATITNDAGRILDPAGNGNVQGNTNYAGYVIIYPSFIDGFRFTFESLDLGTSGKYEIIFSYSSNINDTDSQRLRISSENAAQYVGIPFNLRMSYIYIHFRITSGAPSVPGFQLLYQSATSTTISRVYSEAIGSGFVYNNATASLASGKSIAIGDKSTAMGSSSATGDYATAMGSSSATGDYATAMGSSSATGSNSFAVGYNSQASGNYSVAMGMNAKTNDKYNSFSFVGTNVFTDNRGINDKDHQMMMYFDEYRLLVGTANDVTIIPGKITTNNTLHVFGNRSDVSLNGYGYLSRTAPTGIYTPTYSPSYSIYAASRVLAEEFNAFSDARHKKLRSYSNGKTDLALLNQLKVSNYTFIDTVGKGGKMQLGFIAQEVEKIVPEAINKIQDYIPSIYDMAKSIFYDASAHTLTVTTNNLHDFQAKDEIKLISLDKEHKVKVESIIDAYTFVVAGWEKPVDKLFVFGKRVDDFRTVDYDRLFTLGISSIQELSRRVEQLEKENIQLKAYKDEFSQMKNAVAELKAMISRTSLSDKGIDK